jgi:hypothetical protein
VKSVKVFAILGLIGIGGIASLYILQVIGGEEAISFGGKLIALTSIGGAVIGGIVLIAGRPSPSDNNETKKQGPQF